MNFRLFLLFIIVSTASIASSYIFSWADVVLIHAEDGFIHLENKFLNSSHNFSLDAVLKAHIISLYLLLTAFHVDDITAQTHNSVGLAISWLAQYS